MNLKVNDPTTALSADGAPKTGRVRKEVANGVS